MVRIVICAEPSWKLRACKGGHRVEDRQIFLTGQVGIPAVHQGMHTGGTMTWRPTGQGGAPGSLGLCKSLPDLWEVTPVPRRFPAAVTVLGGYRALAQVGPTKV